MKKTKKIKSAKSLPRLQPTENKTSNIATSPFSLSPYSQHILTSLFIALLSISLYSNTLKNGFTYDDLGTIVNNVLIKDLNNLSVLFQNDYFELSAELTYRPVATFTYFVDYFLYGHSPWGYHLTNILLHAANGVLIYLFLTLLTKHSNTKEHERGVLRRLSTPSLIVPLLFLSNPVLTEAVNAIAYREDLLAFLFYMATLNLYLFLRLRFECQTISSYFLYAISCLLYFLALLSKEMAATLPLIIYGYEWVYYEWVYADRRKNRYSLSFNQYNIGYIVVTIAYIYIHSYYFHNPSEENALSWGLIERISTIPWTLLSYLKLSLFPVLLSLEYEIKPVRSFFSLSSIIPSLIMMLLLATTFLVRNKNKLTALGGFIFFITLIPVYNIIPIVNPFAERYLYFPMLGLTLVAGSAISNLMKIRISKIEILNMLTLVLFVAILSIYSIAVVKRNTMWRDDQSLLSDTIKKMPQSSRAHMVLGYVYASQRMLSDAVAHYQTSIKLKPELPLSHFLLGHAYVEQGRFDAAIQEYRTTLRLKPTLSDAHSNIGMIYARRGKLEEAIQAHQAALRLKPNNPDSHYNLGLAYYLNGKLNEAIEEYLIALKLHSDNIRINNKLILIHNNLGIAYQDQGHLDKAIGEYLTALRLDPIYVNSHYNLANAYLANGQINLARTEFETVIKLQPNYLQARKALDNLEQ